MSLSLSRFFSCTFGAISVLTLGVLCVASTDHTANLQWPNVDYASGVNATDEAHAKLLTSLQRTSIVIGLTRISKEGIVGAVCHQQLQHIQQDVLRGELWALKVLDASGTKPPGFMFGNNYWLGSRELCNAVKHSVHIALSRYVPNAVNYRILQGGAPFDVDYRVVYLRHNSSLQVDFPFGLYTALVHVGLCVPSACSAPELKSLMANYVADALFTDSDVYGMRPQVLYVKDLRLSAEYTERPAFKIVAAFMIFTLAMILCAWCLRLSEPQPDAANSINTAPQADRPAVAVTDGGSFGCQLKNFIKCFDTQTNLRKLYLFEGGERRGFGVISTTRCLSAMVAAYAHVVYFGSFAFTNKTLTFDHMGSIGNAAIFIDIFFTLSGFLQVYHFLRNEQQLERLRINSWSQNFKVFLLMFFHRSLRLVPPYFLTLGLTYLFFVYGDEMSVIHFHCPLAQNCAQYWWRNLLFIQNLFADSELCALWSWSTACEMQFHILGTCLLLLYVKHPNVAKVTTLLILAVNIGWTYVVVYRTNFQFTMDSTILTFTEVYMNPLMRVSSLLVGMIAGWYLAKNEAKIDLRQGFHKWILDNAIYGFLVCGFFNANWELPHFTVASVLAGQRILVAMFLCWAIVGNLTNCTNWFLRLSEAKFFSHLNKLTYEIYLLNPLLIYAFFHGIGAGVRTTVPLLLTLYGGLAVVFYVVSVAFSLAFSMPYYNWSRLMLKRSVAKTKST